VIKNYGIIPIMNKDKITGLFTGILLGDSAGAPVEGFSQEKIKEKYGRITTLLAPDRSWNKDGSTKAGTPTDDWQLSKAVAEGLILSNGLKMPLQAYLHVRSAIQSTKGWGRSTKHSVERLYKGVHWKHSGQEMGVGNGVIMKFGSVGAYSSSTSLSTLKECKKFAIKLAKMTHKTVLAMSSGVIHMMAIRYCLQTKKFDTNKFIKIILDTAIEAEKKCIRPRSDKCKDKLSDRIKELYNHKDYSTQRIIDEFGAGSCYVYNSLPFAYMFFIKNPHNISALFDVINAGGDTDTNGSIVGSLLGAVRGKDIFPQELTESIPKQYYEEVINLSDRFADKFGFN